MRQKGRLRPPNVIDAAPEMNAILEAVNTGLSADFRESLTGMTNPYGDGRASERIVEILANVALDDELLTKRAAPLGNTGWKSVETAESL